MAAVALALFVIYMLGVVVAVVVLPWRIGLNRFAWAVAFMHPGSRRNGIPWAIKAYLKTIIWPVVFGLWLAQDRPPSRVLYGPAAAEELYGDPGKALPGFMTKWRTADRPSGRTPTRERQ